MGVWRKRESGNSGPESRWPPGDPQREAQTFKVKNNHSIFFCAWFSLSDIMAPSWRVPKAGIGYLPSRVYSLKRRQCF